MRSGGARKYKVRRGGVQSKSQNQRKSLLALFVIYGSTSVFIRSKLGFFRIFLIFLDFFGSFRSFKLCLFFFSSTFCHTSRLLVV